MDSPPGFPHTLLERVNRPPGYQQLLQVAGRALPMGENVLRRDWDLCVVLDACRADLFEAALADGWAPPAAWSYGTTTSLDSATEPWAAETFSIDADAVEPVTYVCANPLARAARDSAVVGTCDDVWRYGWDRELRTVPPGIVTDRAVHHCRETDGRVLVHYLQPHMPALRWSADAAADGGHAAEPDHASTAGDAAAEPDDAPRAGDAAPTDAAEPPDDATAESGAGSDDLGPDRRASAEHVERCFEPFGGPEHAGADAWFAAAAPEDSLLAGILGQWDRPTDDPDGCFEAVRFGEVSHERAWDAYRECLDLVLSEVELLLGSVDADDVLVTSDHGNAFGEWGIYAHPYHLPLPVLREVPSLRTSARAEVEYEPAVEGAMRAEGAAAGEGAGSSAEVTEAELAERLAALGYR